MKLTQIKSQAERWGPPGGVAVDTRSGCRYNADVPSGTTGEYNEVS